MKKWPIYSDFSILSHNSGNFGQNEKQVLFSEGATSGTEPSSFPESSMVMCKNVVYQYARHEHRPTIPLQAHCDILLTFTVDGRLVSSLAQRKAMIHDVYYLLATIPTV